MKDRRVAVQAERTPETGRPPVNNGLEGRGRGSNLRARSEAHARGCARGRGEGALPSAVARPGARALCAANASPLIAYAARVVTLRSVQYRPCR